MKLLSSLYVCGLVLAASLLTYPLEAKDHEKVKYVQGGACTPGKGTKSHPFGTLQEAENSSWDVLIVLSSSVALDGGITLKSGQKLVGEEDPTCLGLSPTQPTITNSSNATNGGNGAIIVGQGTIENIHFKNTFRSGILYDLGTDVTIKHVLVTGHNTDGLPFNAAIQGNVTNSGKTCVHKTIIRNSAQKVTTDRGFAEFVSQNAHRDIHISSCEIADVPAQFTTSLIVSAGGTSNITAIIENTYIHDIVGSGINGQTVGTDGNNLTLHVKKSVFTNIVRDNILNFSIGGTITSQICACTFQQPAIRSVIAVSLTSVNADINSTIENCTSNNLSQFVTSRHSDTSVGSTQKVRILNNTVFELIEELGSFYRVINNSPAVPAAQTTETCIEGNLFTGNKGIVIFPDTPWLLLDIKLTDNWLKGFGIDPYAVWARPGNAGTQATITACKNTIVGFSPQIRDQGGTSAINYIVPKNWWGASTGNCTVNSDCAQYQTCTLGQCLGPDNVQTESGYTGTIDPSNPLVAPIKCPRSCCPRENGSSPLLQQSAAALKTSLNLQEEHEIMQNILPEIATPDMPS